jgi:hypothetical protein
VIDEELASALRESGEVWADGSQRATSDAFGPSQIALELERVPVPIRIGEDDVFVLF